MQAFKSSFSPSSSGTSWANRKACSCDWLRIMFLIRRKRGCKGFMSPACMLIRFNQNFPTALGLLTELERNSPEKMFLLQGCKYHFFLVLFPPQGDAGVVNNSIIICFVKCYASTSQPSAPWPILSGLRPVFATHARTHRIASWMNEMVLSSFSFFKILCIYF